MSQRLKIFISSILIMSGVLMINLIPDKKVKTHGIKTSIKWDTNRLSKPFNQILNANNDQKRLALIAMEINTCASCINNALDYIKLLDQKDIPTNILFVDKDQKSVDRFTSRIEFNVPHHSIKYSDLPLALIGSSNELFLISLKDKKLTYRIKLLGNITTTLSYKSKNLKQAL